MAAPRSDVPDPAEPVPPAAPSRPAAPAAESRRGMPPGSAGLLTVSPPAGMVGPAGLSHREVTVIFVGLTLAIFLAALDQTIIAAPLPTIGRAFNDLENLPWVVTAYLLTSTVVAPLYGKLSDIYGRRTMMLIGLGIFTLGSVIAAAAPSMWVLIAGRALQGIGGGGLLPLTQSTIADIVTPRERGRYQAYIGIAWVGAGISGPVIGGLFAEHLHWSLVFWINLPLGLLTMILVSVTLRKLPRNDKPHALDLTGAILLMASAVPLLLALSWGGTRYAWISLPVLGLLALSFLVALWFSLRMMRVAEPFLPVPILANQTVRTGTLAASCTLGTFIGISIMVPLYHQWLHGLSAAQAGLALMPMVAMSTPGSLLAGRVMMYRRRYKWVAIAGLGFAILMLLAMAYAPSMSVAMSAVLLALAGLGMGTVFPIATVSVQNAVGRDEVGIATGTMNFFRSLGSALIVAMMSAIVLAGAGLAPERGTGIVHGAAGGDIATTFSYVFGAAAICLAAAAIAFALMEERELRGPDSKV